MLQAELIAFGLVWDPLESFASHRMLRSSQTISLRAILNSHLFQTAAKIHSLSTCSTTAIPRPRIATRSPLIKVLSRWRRA
jgi:hypothetical protein